MSIKSGSKLLPMVILIGIALFGVGVFQAATPKFDGRQVEYKTTSSPRTVQGPEPPPFQKDAAQRAAEENAVTNKSAAPKSDTAVTAANPGDLSERAWFKTLADLKALDLQPQLMAVLQKESASGAISCTPALTGLNREALLAQDDVTCVSKEGDKLEVELDRDGDIRLNIESTDGQSAQIAKSGGRFEISVSKETESR